mgnify:CR=1 FL=1
MSAELSKNAVDVLDASVKGALGVTAGAGGTTYFNPSDIGLLITILSFVIFVLLSWEKHKINKLQINELTRKRRKEDKDAEDK